ncbi:MAG: ATP-binding response regulator [Terriglobales bacterium]
MLQAAFDEAADGMAVMEGGVVVRTNRMLERILGLARIEMEGKTISELLPQQQRALPSRAGDLKPGIYQIQLGKADSKPLLLECSVAGFSLDQRELRIMVVREIEQRMTYSGAFVEAGPRFGEAERGEVQRLEALGRLAASVYHDFNNVLTAVLLHCGRLLTQVGPRSRTRGTLLEIYRAGQRGAALVSQLLAYAQPSQESGRPLDLNALLEELRDLLQRLVGENVALDLKCAPALPLIQAEATQVERILMNLAANARDAMPEGGRFWLRTWHRAEPGQHLPVVLEVSDSGAGMDAGTRSAAFQAFFTTKGRGQGTGLGLSIVQGLVETAGGRVELESQPGEGTTVSIFFPAAEDAAIVAARTVEAEETVRAHRCERPATVLVVEDDAGVRCSMCEALSAGGHRVLEAQSAEQALLLAAGSEKLDLLLSDLILPGMSGRQLAERLRNRRPEMQALLVSGYPDRASLEQEEGPRFLLKPFTHRQLLDFVEQELERANRNKKQLSA